MLPITDCFARIHRRGIKTPYEFQATKHKGIVAGIMSYQFIFTLIQTLVQVGNKYATTRKIMDKLFSKERFDATIKIEPQ